ncbi:MAG: hypothetical protein A3E00_17245 [Curvibacter sp. RIFCSPHIGHO2_12_FULL_63_18]|uniref:phage holin family protein n=1 Tax=Rhodoferax sp. TaxID=50421 RepID=UPI0008AED77A|nr:phage holin family protein [Rhodoferax sp.]OGO96721.1 MAG: hypothetical protein A2037_09790 [Curvibacter sp. GWA2_63_95]OGO98604.1 MAG: hypothetical protein A3E00_17245 [Curvibacter sp. RIFCSPHIGHO2_12_FULL_63_18]HCX82595.1 hypothetical protein [Rhodoferax sp.]
MLHPLFHLIATQPQLLGDHAQAYGELIGTELATQAAALKRRTLLGALALCLLGVATVLAGVALMLWVTLVPAPPQTTLWVLALVPGIPALLALVCGLLARAPSNATDPAFAELRRQVQADMALLRGLGA